MSIFGGKELFLFSGVNGVVTFNGEPVSGVEIKRVVKWNDTEFEDLVVSENNGNFKFDPLVKNIKSLLPKEFVSYQTLKGTYDGKEYLMWETVKGSDVENGELEGSELIFKCELTDEPRFVHLMLNSIETNCIWK